MACLLERADYDSFPASPHLDRPVRSPLHHRRVEADLLAPPPEARAPLLGRRGEAVLPEDGPHLRRRRAGEGIAAEKGQHVAAACEQADLRRLHPGALSDRAEGGAPEVPLEAPLVGGKDAARL